MPATRFAAAVPLVAALAIGAAAPAPAGAMTTDRAVRLVKRKVDRTFPGGTPSSVHCRKLSSRRFRCTWEKRSRRDIREGDADGHSGTASVVRGRVRLHVRNA